MQTAKLIYISIAVLTILPLIAFNIKKLTIKIEGENPKPNIRFIVFIALMTILLSTFIYTHYKFTINYQPQLVFERYIRSYSIERIKLDPGLKESSKEGRQVRFQLGEIIYPKNYFDKDIFPKVNGVDQNDKRPIYILSMIEFGETRKYFIALLDIDNNKWSVQDFTEASDEIVEYGRKYNFLKSEHANKWFTVK